MYWQSLGVRTVPLAEGKQELTLTRPNFPSGASIMETTLDQEAGMSIWLNATDKAPLNLITAQNAMVNVEANTSNYVVGSISLQSLGFVSDEWPHCFVHKDGWIVVYYLKVNPANPSTTGWVGKMIVLSSSDWYDLTSHQLKDTLLHKALVSISSQLGKSDTSDAQYYHFQYPSATTLELAIKSAGDSETQTFNIRVPSSFTIDERSWSFYSQRGGSWKIDVTQINSTTGRSYGGTEITLPVLTPDLWHTVTVSASYNYYGNFAVVCIIILYH